MNSKCSRWNIEKMLGRRSFELIATFLKNILVLLKDQYHSVFDVKLPANLLFFRQLSCSQGKLKKEKSKTNVLFRPRDPFSSSFEQRCTIGTIIVNSLSISYPLENTSIDHLLKFAIRLDRTLIPERWSPAIANELIKIDLRRKESSRLKQILVKIRISSAFYAHTIAE